MSSSSSDESGSSPRLKYLEHQQSKLEEVFQMHAFIDSKKAQDLAAELGVSTKQIRTWFQNKRAKLKRQECRQSGRPYPLFSQCRLTVPNHITPYSTSPPRTVFVPGQTSPIRYQETQNGPTNMLSPRSVSPNTTIILPNQTSPGSYKESVYQQANHMSPDSLLPSNIVLPGQTSPISYQENQSGRPNLLSPRSVSPNTTIILPNQTSPGFYKETVYQQVNHISPGLLLPSNIVHTSPICYQEAVCQQANQLSSGSSLSSTCTSYSPRRPMFDITNTIEPNRLSTNNNERWAQEADCASLFLEVPVMSKCTSNHSSVLPSSSSRFDCARNISFDSLQTSPADHQESDELSAVIDKILASNATSETMSSSVSSVSMLDYNEKQQKPLAPVEMLTTSPGVNATNDEVSDILEAIIASTSTSKTYSSSLSTSFLSENSSYFANATVNQGNDELSDILDFIDASNSTTATTTSNNVSILEDAKVSTDDSDFLANTDMDDIVKFLLQLK